MSGVGGILRVSVIDSNAHMREGISSILEGRGDIIVVGEAEDGENAVGLAATLSANIILIDFDIAQREDFETIRALLSQASNARIVILAMYPEDAHIAQSVEAGASGYLIKTTLRSTLLDAIDIVKGGGKAFPPAVRMVDQTDGSVMPEQKAADAILMANRCDAGLDSSRLMMASELISAMWAKLCRNLRK